MDRLSFLFHAHPLSFFSEASALIPIFIGLMRWRQADRAIKYVIVFFVLHFVSDFISTAFAYYSKENLFIYNGFSFVEIGMLCLIYSNANQAGARWYQRIVRYGGMAAVVICAVFFRVNELSPGTFSTVCLYGILLVMGFYSELLSRLYIRNILVYSMFWVSNGLLLYFCGTFFIFLLSDSVLSTTVASDTFVRNWNLNLVFYIVLCTTASVGIWFSKYDYGNMKVLS